MDSWYNVASERNATEKKVKEERKMDGKGIMKEAMAERGMTQKQLGDRIGMLQTSVSAGFARDRISLEMFNKLLNGMNYAVAVVDKETGEIKWYVE